jgi:hypothetical protein
MIEKNDSFEPVVLNVFLEKLSLALKTERNKHVGIVLQCRIITSKFVFE